MAQPVDHEELTVPDGRSGCPINMTMELLGDRWSLVVLRDVMFGGRTRFRELLGNSLEGIASNVLASRLAKLTDVSSTTSCNTAAMRSLAVVTASITRSGCRMYG